MSDSQSCKQALILAGGKGTRLKPFTNNIPKPLVPVGEAPILEIILRQLKNAGFTEITLAVSHLARLIQTFFGDGSELGLKISYSLEEKVLGTAGPIRLVNDLKENFLVMNGDVLTTIDYNKLQLFHIENDNDLTISTYKKEVKIDLGVLEIQEGVFERYIEKPVYKFDVSMGIYMLNRKIVEIIPSDIAFDLPELVMLAKRKGFNIGCYNCECQWLDIGRVDDYEKAIDVFEANKQDYLVGDHSIKKIANIKKKNINFWSCWIYRKSSYREVINL